MLYQYLSDLKITLGENLLLLIKLLNKKLTINNIIISDDIYDNIILEFNNIDHELSIENIKLLSDWVAINVAIKMYTMKLSKDINIEDIEFFSTRLKAVNKIMISHKYLNYFIVFEIVSTLVYLEKMIIRFRNKFTNIASPLENPSIKVEQFNNIITEHANIIYANAAKLLLNPNYKQYNELQLSIHQFKRYVKNMQEELMHNRSNYILGQQPGHYLGALTSERELQCDCSFTSVLLLFKKIFISDQSKSTLRRASGSESSLSSCSSSDTLVPSGRLINADVSTSDGLSSDASSSDSDYKSKCFYNKTKLR